MDDNDVSEPIRPRYRPLQPRPRPTSYMKMPLRNRVSFPPFSNRGNNTFFRSHGFVQKTNYFVQRKQRPFGSIMYTNENTRYNGNVYNKRLNKGSFGKWNKNDGVYRGRGKVARGGFVARRIKRPVITREELDRELDEYMKKSKHPHIDVSDLTLT